MKSITKNDNAFTGLEAAIVLIAFVVVAAVFSYVVLGAGFFTTQKSQETVYTGVAQATSNIQMIGQVYGLTSSATSVGAVHEIRFSIGLAPGSPTLDISKMRIAFSTPGTTPVIYTAYTGPDLTTPAYVPGAPVFIAQENGVGSMINSLTTQNQTQIAFKTPAAVSKNTVMSMEIRPSVGASLPFSKSTPPALTYMNVLY
ncbi:MAG: flagellin [Methanoregula sp.]